MAPRYRPAEDEPTSRRRTAELLRRLRAVTREVRMLNADIDAAAKTGARPRHSDRGSPDRENSPKRRTG